jgi:signal transduction histidine kinase
MEDGTRQASEWHWGWDAYVVGVCATAILAVFLLNDRIPGNAPAAAALLAGVAVWDLTVGRRVSRVGALNWRTATFVVVTLAMCVLAVWFSRVAVAAVPAVYPIIFSALPMLTAILVTTAFTVTPLAITLAEQGFRAPDVPLAVSATLLGVVAAPLIGVMVVTATRQRFQLAAVVAELEATRAESARLSREAGVAAERARLAHEIHDTLAQGFTSIVALTQAVQAELDTNPAAACEHIELIGSTARENLAEARVMVAGLTPTALDEGSLAAAVRRQCDRLAAETGIAVRMSVDDIPALGMATDVVLLRATQETFANVRKHSRATDVHVRLATTAGHVRLSLQDNGIGLDADHVEGFGLRGMRSRVAQVGGAMSVSPTPGGGLTVTIEVPA